MSVKIRLKRMGTKRRPYYRIVIMDSRSPRDGRTIEELGYYHPIESHNEQISVKADRVREWLGRGAQPTPTVRRLLNKSSITVR